MQDTIIAITYLYTKQFGAFCLSQPPLWLYRAGVVNDSLISLEKKINKKIQSCEWEKREKLLCSKNIDFRKEIDRSGPWQMVSTTRDGWREAQ